MEQDAGSTGKTVLCFAGFSESVVPVRVGEKIIAYLQTGQVLLRAPTERGFRTAQAQLEKELNLIEKGKNYGWPLVSYAVNYNGVAIDSPDTRADLQKPVIYWTPIIAPGKGCSEAGRWGVLARWPPGIFAAADSGDLAQHQRGARGDGGRGHDGAGKEHHSSGG